jgi:hypothetical protein
MRYHIKEKTRFITFFKFIDGVRERRTLGDRTSVRPERIYGLIYDP